MQAIQMYQSTITVGHLSIIVSILRIMSFSYIHNRFANINLHVYYNTVRGQQSQLLDSEFGLT